MITLITTLGKKVDKSLKCNIGEIKVENGHLYANEYGFWVLIFKNNKFYVNKFIERR